MRNLAISSALLHKPAGEARFQFHVIVLLFATVRTCCGYFVLICRPIHIELACFVFVQFDLFFTSLPSRYLGTTCQFNIKILTTRKGTTCPLSSLHSYASRYP
jgi:hypothetical protein